MSELSDLEIVRACARAMGLTVLSESGNCAVWCSRDGTGREQFIYWPQQNKAQAFELVERFRIEIMRGSEKLWLTMIDGCGIDGGYDDDLCRAVCDNVARMQLAKEN